jgi:hypothetical protein
MSSIQYTLKTNYENFIVKITVLLDRNTKKPLSYNINIGGKEKKCVQIRVPSKESEKIEAYLMWVEADEECSLERYIEKGLAQHMTLLGLTLAKRLNSNIKRVTFEDTSSFLCELPDETILRVPMKAFHIAFHGATWYEYYFKAKQEKHHEQYIKLKENMYKAENKPNIFDFINEELNEELIPIYESTETWNDFFKEISRKYGKKKCAVIYPWLIKAMNEIFESNIYDNTKWYIELDEVKDLLISIKTTNLKRTNQVGGIRKTQKKKKFTFSRTNIFPDIPKIQKWNYKVFLR